MGWTGQDVSSSLDCPRGWGESRLPEGCVTFKRLAVLQDRPHHELGDLDLRVEGKMERGLLSPHLADGQG